MIIIIIIIIYWEQSNFCDAPQRLEAARKYIQQFDVEDDVLVTHSKLENKLNTLKHHEKFKQVTVLDWFKTWILFCFDFCKCLLFHELYFKQLMKKRVLLFWKFEKY